MFMNVKMSDSFFDGDLSLIFLSFIFFSLVVGCGSQLLIFYMEEPSEGSGSNPSGSNPSGSNPSGSNPSGSNPSGSNPSGSNPSGSNPSGGNPSGSNLSGSNSGQGRRIPDPEGPDYDMVWHDDYSDTQAATRNSRNE
uniref:ORF1 n=1 Tax=Macoma balthica TaxID=1903275 RepID=A0A6B7FS29_MACBL|nr:ORF1 [Macoma balthica]